MTVSTSIPLTEDSVKIMAAVLRGSFEAAKELNINLVPLLKEQHIDPESFAGFLSYKQLVGFLDSVSARHNCPHFGFLIAKHQPPQDFGPGRQLLPLSPTLHEMLSNIDHYQTLYQESARYHFEIDGQVAILRRDHRYPQLPTSAQLRTLGIFQLLKACKAFCGKYWVAGSVHLGVAATPEASQYAKYSNSRVMFNAEFDGIVIPKHLLHLENSATDPDLYKMVRAYCDNLLTERKASHDGDLVGAVQLYIRQHMGTERCNLQACAAKHDAHPRVFQRALERAGRNFQQLLLEQRIRIAKDYMQSSELPLTEISELLGYSSLSNFSRAFSISVGESPREWRRRAGSNLTNKQLGNSLPAQ